MNLGADFINEKYQSLHTEFIVENTNKYNLSRTPSEKINDYLLRLENIHKKAYENERMLLKLKNAYYRKYVIDEKTFPEEYFEKQKQIAFKKGLGELTYSDEQKKEIIDSKINDQKESLSKWIDFLKQNEELPMWFKFWAFQGIVKLGAYNKKDTKFNRRTPKTTLPFIEVNEEVLKEVYKYINNYLEKGVVPNDEFLEKLVKDGNFKKLFTHFYVEHLNNKKSETNKNVGVWKTFKKGSDPNLLIESIDKFNTGWCISKTHDANKYIKKGDVHIYFTNDQNNLPNIPRIAITMTDLDIHEVRGIDHRQNIEPELAKVASDKLKEFPYSEEFEQKTNDMRLLTDIYTKNKKGESLSKEELEFLYQIKRLIYSFGEKEDPRIKKIIDSRDIKKDLGIMFGYDKKEIAISIEEAFESGKKFYYGNVGSNQLKSVFNYQELVEDNPNFVAKFPPYMKGSFYLEDLKPTSNIIFPEKLDGSIIMKQSIENLKLPATMTGTLNLGNLDDASKVEFPKYVGGRLDLSSLSKLDNAVLPVEVGKSVALDNVKFIKKSALPIKAQNINLKNLEEIDDYNILKNYENIELSEGLKIMENFQK